MSIIMAGVNLPEKKKTPYALTYIKGIGLYSAKKICKALSLDENVRLEDVSKQKLVEIQEELKNYLIENDLLVYVSNCIKTHKTNRTYRGIRHTKRLPVRGQRTHTNAETRRSGKA